MSVPVHPPAAPEPRSALRRLLETRGTLGGLTRPHLEVRLHADDGTPLAGAYVPGPDRGVATLVVHGFAAHHRKPSYARLAEALAGHAPTLTLDLRGHGRSGGRSTLGDLERLDVTAGVRWLREAGHPRVVVVGASMGATSAVHAAATGLDCDGLVLVSAPAWLHDPPQTEPMRRLAGVWRSRAGRTALRAALGVRVVPPTRWCRPDDPVELAAQVTAPTLLVHGADDAYFPPGDADALAAALAGPVQLWHEPAGFGHAEDGFTSPLLARLAPATVALGGRP